MCKEEDRMQIFQNSWCDQNRPKSTNMVDAVFYYKNYGDRVCWFYCGDDYLNGKPTTTSD